jgi:hypothetical protein
MYTVDKLYRSTVYYTSQLVPSGVITVEGESYGVRTDDPTGQSPSVAITVPELRDAALELGSFGSTYNVVFTINAKSRLQRDALKSIIQSGLRHNQIPIYSDFTEFVPASGSSIETYAGIGDYFQIRNMPNFDSDREKFFWVSVVFVTLDLIGL